MSAALQLFFALLWWIVLAALAACLGLATLVVCVTIVDRWRDRQCRTGTRGPERPPVGKPPTSLTVHTSSGKRTLTPIKGARAVDAAGPMTGGDHSDERKSY